MQIVGNGSSNYFLHWYQDHAASSLPQGFVVSLPMWVFRLFMLLWSLWLAFKVPVWGKWGWTAFSDGGAWRKGETPKRKKKIIKKVEQTPSTVHGFTEIPDNHKSEE